VAVLIIRKTTNYELYGVEVQARAKEGLVAADTVGLLSSSHKEHYATLEKLKEIISGHGHEVTEIRREEKNLDLSKYEHIFTVGGDGTLLASSHMLPESRVVLGVRSSASSVGYLCGASFDTLEDDMKHFFDGKSESLVAQRLVADVKYVSRKETFKSVPILNDFLYSNISPAATTRYAITHGGKKEAHRSSGIWIATAMGSTAGIYTAGGQKVPQEDTGFQFRVRELYKMGLTDPEIEGAFFDPDKDELIISNRCQDAILATDGQHGEIKLQYGDEIRFKRTEPLHVVKKRHKLEL
jgi:NAD+ kinase